MYNAIKDDVAAAAASEQRTLVNIKLSTYREFTDILKIKFKNQEYLIKKELDNEFDKLLFLGLKEYTKQESSFELIHKDKLADKRVLKKMGKIVSEIIQANTYPIIQGDAIMPLIRKAFGDADSRVLKDYRKTILHYCNLDEDIIEKCADTRLGEIDVTSFVRHVPRKYVHSFVGELKNGGFVGEPKNGVVYDD